MDVAWPISAWRSRSTEAAPPRSSQRPSAAGPSRVGCLPCGRRPTSGRPNCSPTCATSSRASAPPRATTPSDADAETSSARSRQGRGFWPARARCIARRRCPPFAPRPPRPAARWSASSAPGGHCTQLSSVRTATRCDRSARRRAWTNWPNEHAPIWTCSRTRACRPVCGRRPMPRSTARSWRSTTCSSCRCGCPRRDWSSCRRASSARCRGARCPRAAAGRSPSRRRPRLGGTP